MIFVASGWYCEITYFNFRQMQCVVMITCMYGSVRGMRESGKLAAAGIQEVLLLRSTSLLRKYISFVDAAWTSLFHRFVSIYRGVNFGPLALWCI